MCNKPSGYGVASSCNKYHLSVGVAYPSRNEQWAEEVIPGSRISKCHQVGNHPIKVRLIKHLFCRLYLAVPDFLLWSYQLYTWSDNGIRSAMYEDHFCRKIPGTEPYTQLNSTDAAIGVLLHPATPRIIYYSEPRGKQSTKCE